MTANTQNPIDDNAWPAAHFAHDAMVVHIDDVRLLVEEAGLASLGETSPSEPRERESRPEPWAKDGGPLLGMRFYEWSHSPDRWWSR